MGDAAAANRPVHTGFNCPTASGSFVFGREVFPGGAACDNGAFPLNHGLPMLRDVLQFIIQIVFSLFGIALILRAWIYAIRLHPFNPYSQTVFRITDWLVRPIRRVLPSSNKIDWPSLLACWLTALVSLLLMVVIFVGLPTALQALLPSCLAALFTVAKWAFNVILWVTLIQAILSWVNPLAPIMPVLQTLTAPLLDPIRRILPNLGGLDLSPLVLLVLAQLCMMVLQRFEYSLVVF
jgi:YggT family protein